jgi:hypothetical protein
LTEDLNNLTDGYKFKMNLFSNLEKEKQNSLEQKQTILEITKHIDTLLIRSVKEEDPSAFLIDITPEKPIFLLNAMSFEKTEEVIPEKEIDNVVAMSKPKSGKLKKIANKIKIAASLLFVSALSLVTGSKTQAPNKQAHEIFARPVMNKTVIITPQQNKPTIKAEKLEAKSFSAPLEKKTAQAVTVKHRHDEKVHPATDRDARNTDSLKVVSLHVEDVQKQEMVFKSILENKKIVLQNDTLSKTISIDSAQRVSKLSFTF